MYFQLQRVTGESSLSGVRRFVLLDQAIDTVQSASEKHKNERDHCKRQCEFVTLSLSVSLPAKKESHRKMDFESRNKHHDKDSERGKFCEGAEEQENAADEFHKWAQVGKRSGDMDNVLEVADSPC